MNKIGSAPSFFPTRDAGKAYKTQWVMKRIAKLERLISLEYIEEARVTLDSVIESANQSYDKDIRCALAECCYNLEAYDKCLSVLEEIKPDKHKKDSRVLNLKGRCQLKKGNKKYANELFEMVVLGDPDFVAALNNLGNIAMHKQDYERCILYYNKSKGSRQTT